jgi:hypothetical protein
LWISTTDSPIGAGYGARITVGAAQIRRWSGSGTGSARNPINRPA